jgi:predicted metal-dependent phosphotriesterase family hydrolase
VTFVRTILGDVAADGLGIAYAHEHLVIDGGRPVELYPDFLLDDGLMNDRGLGDDVRRKIFVDNPARAFPFTSPPGRLEETS